MSRCLAFAAVLFVVGVAYGDFNTVPPPPKSEAELWIKGLEDRIKALEEKVRRLESPGGHWEDVPHWCDSKSCKWNGSYCVCTNNVGGGDG